MKKNHTFRLAMLGMFTAIATILTFTPLGYISTPFMAITTLHIPIIVAAILFGPMDGSIVGGIVGLLCMLKAAIVPTSLTDPLFVNPLVSLIPRILIGLVAAWVFIGICKLFQRSQKAYARAVPAFVAAIAGTLTNTIGVLTAFSLLYPTQASEFLGLQVGSFGAIFRSLVLVIFATNGLFEIVAAIVLAVPIVLAVDKARNRHGNPA